MQYVIIGAGPAGLTAAETLRQQDPEGDITLVGDEPGPPYGRMALPYLLSKAIAEPGLHLRQDEQHLKRLGVEQARDRAQEVSPAKRTVTLQRGTVLSYDRLLVASGSRPVLPDIAGNDREGVHTCWSLADVRNIDRLAQTGAKVVLVGAGFIGCTVIQALADRGVELTVVEMADQMAPRMLSPTAARLVQQACAERGVRVLTSRRVAEIGSGNGTPLNVRLEGGESLPASLIVMATGVTPAVDFLSASGIEIDHGVLADDHLRTSEPDVFAAGDVAEGPTLHSGKRNVYATQPAAVDHGRIAALNMAGRDAAFGGSMPMNLLDTMGLVSCSLGSPDGADDDSCELLDEPGRRYLRLAFSGERLVGAQTVGHVQFLGALRGLIQTGVELGDWKQRLLAHPERVAEAFVARTVI